jgi:uncharacterized protein YjbI with pentapeptide repeats
MSARKKIAQERAETDREIADQRAQDDALQAYLNHIGELLLDKDRPLRQSKERDEVGTLARARTLTVLTRLGGERKGSIVRFLYESDLITKDPLILDLRSADLSCANLRGAQLSYAELKGADLIGANLSKAILSEVDLGGYADLRVDLSGADLSVAYLVGARGLNDEQLEQAASLEGATMPNGQKYED